MMTLGLCAVLIAPTLNQTIAKRAMPDEFVSDGCSLFPDGNYRACCVEHDKAYYFGGTKKERKAADRLLRDCVRAKGHRFLAPAMYIGVRIGGVAFLPTPFRWGFGKKKPKKDGEATQQKFQVQH
ncbi:MAG: hypothetical protein ABIP78_01240 [Pyrinomonadaceae bacterium]